MSWTAGKTWAVGDTLTASDLNTHIAGRLDWLKGETAWNSPAFVNGWYAVGGIWSHSGYKRSGDRVFLRGDYAGGTWGATIFTLPAGYRPLEQYIQACVSNDALARVDVHTDGTVVASTAIGGSNAYLFLETARWWLT